MKKVVSFVLSAAMMLSVMSPLTAVGFADDTLAESTAVQTVASEEAQPAESAASSEEAQPAESAASSEKAQPAESAASSEEAQPAESAASSEEAQPAESAASSEEAQPAESAASSEEAQPEEESDAVKAAVEALQALPAAEDVAAMTEEELEALNEALAAALDALDALSEEEYASFEQTYADLCQAMQDVMAAAEARMENGAATQSLRPMKEYTGLELKLSGYSKEQYKAFSVDDLMNLLKDSSGNPVRIDTANASTVWFSFNAKREEVHKLHNGETVNLWEYWGGTSEYDGYTAWQPVVMVVGSGNQMDDANNTRYVFNEELTVSDRPNSISGYLDLRKPQDPNSRLDVSTKNVQSDNFEGMGIFGFYAVCTIEGGYNAADPLMLSWIHAEEKQLENAGYTLQVYDAAAYKADPANAQPIALTQDGNLPIGAAENKWVVVYRAQDGKVAGMYGISVSLQDAEVPSGLIYLYKNGQISTNSNETSRLDFGGDIAYHINPDYEAENIVQNFSCGMLYHVGYVDVNRDQLNDVYMAIYDNGKIKGVYEGYYDSENDIPAGADNLKAQMVVDKNAALPHGYCLSGVNTDKDITFTVVETDGTCLETRVRVYTSRNGSSDSEYSNWFSVYSLKDAAGNHVDSKTVGTVKDLELDSYYSNYNTDISGYSLVLLPNAMTESELKALVPSFDTSNNNASSGKKDKVYSNGEMISGVTNLENALWLDMDNDGRKETVQFTVVTPDDKSKNYRVTFAAKQAGGSLFVPGPEERLINLTIDNKYAHDVMVANLGDADVQIESVSIENAQNVAIDDYWTIQPGSTLKALTTSTGYTYTDENGEEQTVYNRYASSASMAKVRLVPNGSGKISGTLVVKASDGSERRIKLTGVAALPGFTTDAVSEGVKYVPYGFMVATDNMYAWNTDTFELVSGKLPEGVVLKSSGEIYGTPQEEGEFNFTVRVKHSSDQFAKYPTDQEFTLVVNNNSDANVYAATDDKYEIKQALGAEQTPGSYDFYLADASRDQIFSSQADYLTYPDYPNSKMHNFKALWLNGQKLEEGTDYVAEQGSTVITIRSQTFANKANRNGANTIAMEFRVNGSEENELKRTAQNFYMDQNTSFSSGGGSSHSSAADTGSENGNQSGTAAAASGAAGNDPFAVSGSANLTIRVLDANGSAMVGVTVVLQSTPRSTVTDGVGRAVFTNVEFGQHTISVVKNGQTLATSQFALVKSADTAVVNGAVYCPDGGNAAFSVHVTNAGTVTLDEGSAVKLASGTAGVPQTGDDSHLLAWAILLGAAMLAGGAMLIRAKKH